jgi:hypothetical protein
LFFFCNFDAKIHKKDGKAMLLMLKNYKISAIIGNKKAASMIACDFLYFSVLSGASYSWLM